MPFRETRAGNSVNCVHVHPIAAHRPIAPFRGVSPNACLLSLSSLVVSQEGKEGKEGKEKKERKEKKGVAGAIGAAAEKVAKKIAGREGGGGAAADDAGVNKDE